MSACGLYCSAGSSDRSWDNMYWRAKNFKAPLATDWSGSCTVLGPGVWGRAKCMREVREVYCRRGCVAQGVRVVGVLSHCPP